MRKRRSRQAAMPGISRLYLVSQWLQSFPARPFIGDRCSRNMRKRRSRQAAMPGISRLYLVSQWLPSFPARPFIGRQAGFWGDWTQECPWDGQERSGLQERLQREARAQA